MRTRRASRRDFTISAAAFVDVPATPIGDVVNFLTDEQGAVGLLRRCVDDTSTRPRHLIPGRNPSQPVAQIAGE
jgi:hypothetical protein